MSQYQDQKLGPAKFLTIATNLFNTYFIAAQRDEAKNRFKQLSEGKRVPLVNLEMEDKSQLTMLVQLDTTEYRGKMNFSAFRQHLALLLTVIVEELKKDEPKINLFEDESGRKLMFHHPALSVTDEELNVLVLGADLSVPGQATLQLLFLDPDQFRREDKAEES